ncbi:MAG TPA: DNA-directed RNA polymerase subunit alpha C-terminal domain-containing protein [Saprospiraceae bacterium]|nr:DNA-directed RNA polymerase subunit alpha C-terminal domain-containing protein [Saprospiraceae bacterium]
MKVFISWSGNRSQRVAHLLDKWISCVIQAVDPWISTKDIDKGSLWFSEISNILSSTQTGIVCLTKSNLNNPWILFEAGALAKGLTSNRVFTFLIDLEPKDVKDPLAQFNHTEPRRESLYQLVRTINGALVEKSLKESILENVFDTYWPQFANDCSKILSETKEEDVKEERPEGDVLNEILYSVRAMDRRLRNLENYPLEGVEDKNRTKKLLGTIVENLNLSEPVYKMLKAAKIKTLADLVRFDTHELLEFRNMSNKSLIEIEEMLVNNGLTFGMDISIYGF